MVASKPPQAALSAGHLGRVVELGLSLVSKPKHRKSSCCIAVQPTDIPLQGFAAVLRVSLSHGVGPKNPIQPPPPKKKGAHSFVLLLLQPSPFALFPFPTSSSFFLFSFL